ncbi:MAG: hypothetical protein ACLU30_12975 [Odoribacter splanchnicus]
MNYFTKPPASAELLCRMRGFSPVYLYQQDYAHALNNALTVIDAHKFSWVDPEIFLESDPAKKTGLCIKNWSSVGMPTNR